MQESVILALRSHSTLTENSKIKKTDNTKYWRGSSVTHMSVNDTTFLGNYLAVSWKVEHIPTQWPQNSTPRYLSKVKESISTKRCM